MNLHPRPVLLALLAMTLVTPPPPIVGAPQQHREPRRRLHAVSDRPLALVGAALIDGTGAPAVARSVVVVRGDRIVAAGPADLVAVPANATVIQLDGATVLPGFINAHVHSSYSRSRLAAWARAGVTTVRDLMGPRDFDLVAELGRDPSLARVVAAGPFVTVPGGYPIVPWGATNAVAITSLPQARTAVEQLARDGAQVIKIAIETGQEFGRIIPTLSLAQAQVIVETAHAAHLPVSVHLTRTVDVPRALDAGADDLAHMVTDTLSATLAARVAAQGTVWVPTLELWHGVGQGRDAAAILNLARFVTAGGTVALGTDYGGYTTPFELGMPNLEISLMIQAGMTPMQVIVAATRNAARVCGRADDLGTIEVGKLADILVVRGDPLADVSALDRTLLVFHGGVVIRDETAATNRDNV